MRPTLIAGAVCLALLLSAKPAEALEDRGVLRPSLIQADASTELRGHEIYLGSDAYFTAAFDYDRATKPWINGQFRLADRHRIVFNYFRFKDTAYGPLSGDIRFDDVVIPVGTTARGDTEFTLGGLAYDYAFVETPTVSLGAQIGLQYTRLKGRVRAEAAGDVYDESGDEDAPLPVVGLRLTTAPSGPWRFEVQGQYLDVGWAGQSDYDGSLTLAHALAEYRFSDRVGVHAGYNWFRLDLEDNSGDTGIVGLDEQFEGPVAGVTLAF